MTEMIDRYASPVDAAVFQTITQPDFVDWQRCLFIAHCQLYLLEYKFDFILALSKESSGILLLSSVFIVSFCVCLLTY